MAGRWCRLYASSTPAELAMEEAVATLGICYRTQFPCFLFGLRYFLDVYLPTIGVVIEVDDPSHFKGDKPEKDAERTETLEREWGVVVVRATNEEVLEDAHGTLRRLMAESGRWPANRSRSLQASLPNRKRAPQAQKREAKSESLQRRRSKSLDKLPLKSSVRPSGPATAG